MGFAPEQVDRMTLWQFIALTDARREANGTGKSADQSLDYSDHELRAMGIDV